MDGQVNPAPETAGRNPEVAPQNAVVGMKRPDAAFIRMKSPVLATVLSAMPGLGQVYLGYYRQGFINILLVASLITVLNRGAGGAEPFCGILLAFFWMFNLVDAARKATQYNQALAGMAERAEELPQPSKRDSLVAGVAIALLGVLLLANTRFGLSLEWIERWWPVVLVLTGGYMVASYLMDQRKDGRTI